MCQGEVRAHQRVLGGLNGKPASEILQARGDGAHLVLIGDNRGIHSEHRLWMARCLGLLVLDRLDGFGERGTAANIVPLVVTIVVTG